MPNKRPPTQLELLSVAPRRGFPTPLSRATATRYKEAPAPLPWLATLIAVDTANRSGWAISKDGQHLASGELDTLDEAAVQAVVDQGIAAASGGAIVLILEAPYGGSLDVVTALGAARERWQRAWRVGRQSPERVLRIQPSTWRAPVLGSKWMRSSRVAIRAREQQIAALHVGHAVGPDEAPAILIARWGAHARAVGKAIGKRAQRASVKSWMERKG